MVAVFDGDGLDDLVVANNTGDTISILLNNGNGTTYDITNYPQESEPTSIAVGFID